MMKKVRHSFLSGNGMQTFLTSLLSVAVGLVLGYLVLLLIEPSGAGEGMTAVLSGCFAFPGKLMLKYLGQTLVRTVPLLLCAISVIFAYSGGFFNIGVAGQYTVGACAALYGAIAWSLPWYVCLLLGIFAAGLWGGLCAMLKLYCNVNVVISGIMLNWIALYLTNWILGGIKDPTGPFTPALQGVNPSALLPSLGLEKLFFREKSVTIAIPLALALGAAVWVVLRKTVFGYELKATGHSLHASRYAGMNEKRNLLLVMVIAGALAGTGAVLLYLSGMEQWSTTQSALPAVGFSGIAAAFLGGLDPFGAMLSAFFIQHITMGGGNIDLRLYSPQIADLIASLIIYLCAFAGCFRLLLRRKSALGRGQMSQKEGGRVE